MKLNIEMGCGKGKKCSIGLYILPQGLTKEEFSRLVKKQLELMEDHAIPEKYIEVGHN